MFPRDASRTADDHIHGDNAEDSLADSAAKSNILSNTYIASPPPSGFPILFFVFSFNLVFGFAASCARTRCFGLRSTFVFCSGFSSLLVLLFRFYYLHSTRTPAMPKFSATQILVLALSAIALAANVHAAPLEKRVGQNVTDVVEPWLQACVRTYLSIQVPFVLT